MNLFRYCGDDRESNATSSGALVRGGWKQRGTPFLAFSSNYGTLGGVRDKESTAITITLPRALDRALQALADQKHCGNKSAAIREVLYKEAGMKGKLRINEKTDNTAIAKAERRAVKYGSRKRKNRK